MSVLISEEYRRLNAELHESNPHYGTIGGEFAATVLKLIYELQPKSILDYGCGKGLLRKVLGRPILEYDPAIPALAAAPEPADLVICTDVLEHVEPECLEAVLDDLKRVTLRRIFLNVTTVPAVKRLADGRNAHLIVQPIEWWMPKLLARFQQVGLSANATGFTAVLAHAKEKIEKQTIKILPATDPAERIENIRSAMLRGLPELAIMPAHDRTMVLACPGPSLKQTWPQIKESADLFTVSGAHDFLIERGIIPAAHVECETRSYKITLLQARKRSQSTMYYLASCCPPSAFEFLDGVYVQLWHCKNSEEERKFIYKMDHDAFLVDGGSSVSLCAIALGSVLGYRSFDCHGMDCSWQEDEAYVMKHPNPEGIKMKMRRSDTNESWWTNPQLYVAADEFQRFADGSNYNFHLRGKGMLQSITRGHLRINHDA